MGLSKSDPIIIVGAGSFGLSAALHLSQRGYTDILVFGKDNHAPSGDLSIVVYRTAQDAGVQFFLGQQVDEIVYVSTLTGRKNAGIRTQDGRFYRSALVIIEAGAGDSQSMPAIDPMHDSLATPCRGTPTSRIPSSTTCQKTRRSYCFRATQDTPSRALGCFRWWDLWSWIS
ncbi:hypothetical protein N7499_001301 [Penicillium canescens]|uniref:FAD dependent oxidoreductase domain-containing protein n=1 Tax=Penicillium canescens TaxID=5083 RepID=A0AAD6I3U0_PENCN|nr:hypothetical protein N7460_012660 [Penicillium canescens]KAJ6041125.1 hypothetical protein N7444_010030 [Penicillium canescens]KAJ6101671.1 hypothetical protein N7499_001301 [Penicillium canescens]